MLYRGKRFMSGTEDMVLFWVPGGLPLMLHVEGAIAKALQLRGIEIHAVICDGPFRACMKREVTDGIPIARWQDSCAQCKAQTSSVLNQMSVPFSFIGDYVPESTRSVLWEKTTSITWNSLDDLRSDDINLGKNARSAIIRYLQGNELTGHEKIVREYAFSALVSAAAAANVMDCMSPSRVFMSTCTYIDWGPALQTALAREIPITAWMASYLSGCFYFRSIEDPRNIDKHDLSHKAWEELKREHLFPFQESRLDKFLEDRYQNKISFDMKHLENYKGDMEYFHKKFSLTSDRPVWGIMAHLNWDVVSDYSPMAYPSFDDWMLDTIPEIEKITDVQWLIKMHPAETWSNPASGVQRLIEKHFPSLPDHLRVIPADEKISPLDFFQLIDGGVTVYGTSGLELALFGKPVILGGEAHYGGKGFTYEGLSPKAYRKLLRRAGSLERQSEEQQLLARKYAYCYFIQKQVPFPVVQDPHSEWWCYQPDKEHLLSPGMDPFVDFICEKILDGTDFIMDEELVSLSRKDPTTEAIESERHSIATTEIHQTTEAVAMKPTSGNGRNHSVSKLLGFDPLGEVFTFQDRLFRGIFPGHGPAVHKLLEAYQNHRLWEWGIVDTSLAIDPDFRDWGYDMVLEHESIPHITYAHEWSPEMLKDAALFQLELNQKLHELGLMLKDCGVSSNVLFKFTQPVFVDFLSIITNSDLTQQAWLKPNAIRSPFQVLWSEASSYFNEIFCRMFYPGMHYPLYLMHQGHHNLASKRLFETALNTSTDMITEQEALAPANDSVRSSYLEALAAREHALVNDDRHRYFDILRQEINALDVSLNHSDYSNYYEAKNENFEFTPSNAWGPKQIAVYEGLKLLQPYTILDVGANTGWFSILAAKMGARVVSIDTDAASVDILYRYTKREGIQILPLVMNLLEATPDVPARSELADDPHELNSKIEGDVPLLLAANRRLKSDLVLALALIHHLTLGQGLTLEAAIQLLASYSKEHMILEFVHKEDPLIQGEPEFFPAFNRDPQKFDEYTQQECHRILTELYSRVEVKQLTGSRIMFICTRDNKLL